MDHVDRLGRTPFAGALSDAPADAGALFDVPRPTPVSAAEAADADAAADAAVLLLAPDDDLPPAWLLPEVPEPNVAALIAADPVSAPEPSAADRLAWAEAEPSFGLAAALVHDLDPAALDAEQQVRLLTLTGRLSNQADGLRLAAVAAVAGPEPHNERSRREDFADCEVAAALNLSVRAGASYRVEPHDYRLGP